MVDEVHHLPALADTDPEAAAEAIKAGEDQSGAWSRAILPLLECAAVRLLLSGTLERADGKGVLWLPYRKGPKAKTREIALDAPGWAVIGYSRAQALQERAVLPVTFGALDIVRSWIPATQAATVAQLATSDTPGAHEALDQVGASRLVQRCIVPVAGHPAAG